MFAARMDEFGKPAWIAMLVVSFILWWPLGLICLGYLFGSGRMGCWAHADSGDRWQRHLDRMQRKMDRVQAAANRVWSSRSSGSGPSGPSSGNRAFDEYRDETLRRLEEEQREFMEFLQRLRHAKDKAEFDQFMADRHRHGPATPYDPGPSGAQPAG
ncbi:MAG: DUF2852 domain-containing protein [Alphaproteobacteria bacterium]|nr:DUF2852 domain-containing protein [Alphaproteobacteria bacterium]